jgi:hypothetical protein
MARVRAREARCCMPPESWWGYWSAASVSCTSWSQWSTSPGSALRGRPRAMFCRQVSQGNSRASWNIIPSFSPAGRFRVPEEGSSSPARSRRKVVFPHPDLPRITVHSPVSRDKSRSCRTLRGPYTFEIWQNSIVDILIYIHPLYPPFSRAGDRCASAQWWWVLPLIIIAHTAAASSPPGRTPRPAPAPGLRWPGFR